jgi:hypothetical protein
MTHAPQGPAGQPAGSTGALEGIALSGPPAHPQVRVKGRPSPYARPSVSLTGAAAVKRRWATVPVTDLAAGDTVPGLGLLHLIVVNWNEPFTVAVTGADGAHARYPGDATVFAFTAADSAVADTAL